jgi:hypothetical protein
MLSFSNRWKYHHLAAWMIKFSSTIGVIVCLDDKMYHLAG